MEINPMLLCDAYKIGHPFQYPKNTTLVYSNLTPRNSRIKGTDKMVFFGLQYFMNKYLIKYFNDNFFNVSKELVIDDYKNAVKDILGYDLPSYKHIEDLHDLGYLPIRIKALPEGSSVHMKVPVLTIVNTHPNFYWVTNFIETLMSTMLWQCCTSATIAKEYKKIFTKYAIETGADLSFVDWQGHFVNWQGHDFSFRGMSSLESAILSGMGHLTSFKGTDTIPAIQELKKYYFTKSSNDIVGGSVAATEHSVMCVGTIYEETEESYKVEVIYDDLGNKISEKEIIN